MNGQALSILLALLTGVALTVQTGINAKVRIWLDNPLQAAFLSFCVGGAVVGAMLLWHRAPLPFARIAAMPWWMWLGGCLGVVIVTMNIVLAPRLGAALLVALAVAGQAAAALALDHYGALGFPQHSISLGRVSGAALLLGGVVLMRYT